MRTNIDRVYTVIHYGKEQVYNVYYKSGTVRQYYDNFKNTIPDSVKRFIKNSYHYFLQPDIKLYKLTHD